MLTIGHFLEALTDYRVTGDEPRVSTVVIDSRQAQQSSVFFAFKGENVDGHQFVPAAFAMGAIAALVERPDGDGAWVLQSCRCRGIRFGQAKHCCKLWSMIRFCCVATGCSLLVASL